MKMIFISSPYTIGDCALNVREQILVADELMNAGLCPVLPLLSHFQHIVKPRSYEDWLRIDFEKIKRCDALLRLPGVSKGANSEVSFAIENSIPVFYHLENIIKEMRGH
jgi:hypothetical protein